MVKLLPIGCDQTAPHWSFLARAKIEWWGASWCSTLDLYIQEVAIYMLADYFSGRKHSWTHLHHPTIPRTRGVIWVCASIERPPKKKVSFGLSLSTIHLVRGQPELLSRCVHSDGHTVRSLRTPLTGRKGLPHQDHRHSKDCGHLAWISPLTYKHLFFLWNIFQLLQFFKKI